jgi:hypothetical protein
MDASPPANGMKISPSSTPRGSVDANGKERSSSPRFEGLRRRFRSSSTINSASSETLPPVEIEKPPGKTEALRAAKRFLLSTIRNDWAYSTGGVTDTLSGVHIESREPLDYRTRVDGSSDFESDGPAPKKRAGASKSTGNDPYKFDSPDAIGTSIIEKKTKKRKLLEEEMEWNEGVRTYAKRRDAWTGATDRWPGKRKRMGPGFDTGNTRNGSNSTDISGELRLTTFSSKQSSSADSMAPVEEGPGPWLPVYPPLLPDDNLVRANITPAAYTTIYSKVVIQSLTPTVPIPLTHMTQALIQGWKAEGQWPPQSTAPVTAVSHEGTKKSSGLLKFRKYRANVEKSRVKKGLGAVKKALGGEPHHHEDPGVDLDFEEQQDAEAAENTELNKGLVEANSTQQHS